QVGCPTKISQDGEQPGRICPRCSNVAVVSAKSRMWFELQVFFIPLIPMPSSNIWLCTICQWEVPHQQGYEPTLPGAGFHPGNVAMPQQPQQGYGVGTGK
ncbi:hypothetical protein BU17DRAFT_50391, partial [Hysterangium stoloniferum]